MSVRVRVPASSANLGPGFDTLGLALSLHAEIGIVGDDEPGGPVADEHHPATVAFRRAGGTGRVWVRSPIPVGRGMGFSGAVRVGGVVAAHAQRHGADRDAFHHEVPAMLALSSELEGHADNAAASLLGGAVATAAGRAVRIPLGLDPAVVAWIPEFTTSTDESRAKLGASITFDDAVFNVGRTALLVAALAAGDVDALRSATEDRLHQDVRLARAEPSRAALQALLEAGAWAAWLSGSGPTVAGLCAGDVAEKIASSLPVGGRGMVLSIDRDGAVVLP